MIMVTITRIAGIKLPDGQIDSVWESYFLIVAAEIGVILASISTYRALFVSHRKENMNNRAGRGTGDQGRFSSPRTRQLMKRVFVTSPWRSRARGQSTPPEGEDKEQQYNHSDTVELPEIPRVYVMTGVRSFINNGRGKGTDAFDLMEHRRTQDDDDDWPLRREGHDLEDTRSEEKIGV